MQNDPPAIFLRPIFTDRYETDRKGGWGGLQQPCIRIAMLGEFRVTVGDAVVSGGGARANQIWNLL